ncbi:MAG: AAA family ATPase [Proteobacteria bacterium]|nr:AAA family ATPase [Pseudomonadota bacterium]MBU1056970.1 AAA family ATPase [Pseudomonadota bacterium]
MQTEKNRERVTPFQEDCNTSFFFFGGGRGAVYDDLKAAFQGGVDLITLIGEEGSGKTMLCKMLQEKWAFSGKILFLPQLAESFEDIVRVAAQECNAKFPVEANRADARNIFLELVASLRQQGESLLIICDEAEKMYLATLERIRKILDDVNREGGGLQVLLSGRASLLGNLEQLDLCNFEQISEKQFFLSPLNEDDTWKYLNFCMQAQEGNEPREVFSREAADKIASMARGNLRMINVLAEESLQSSTADTSFMVLLDHVKDSCPLEEMVPASPWILQRLPLSQKQMLAVGGAVLFLLFLIVVFSGDGDKEIAEKAQTPEVSVVISQPVSEKEVFDQRVADEGKEVEQAPSVPVAEVIEPPVMTIAPVEIMDDPSLVKRDRVIEEATPLLPVVEPPEPVHDPDQQVESVAQIPLDLEGEVENEAEEDHAPQQRPEEIVATVVPEETVPELLAHGKVLPGGGTKKIVVERGKQLSGAKEQVSVKEEEPALVSLIGAGEEWQAGAMDDQFTIQLMVLTSNQAEENLKRILSQEEYRDLVDDLVVLKRPSNPPVVLVFYGLYPSMAAAREARNTMPMVFRQHNPYAISVRGAVEKGRFQE